MLAAPGLLQATPPTPELAAAALRVCAESEAAAIPVGAGSKLARGRLPRKADVLLSTAALDQVSDHQPADLTVSTQTGVPLATLQAALAAAGQFLAVDPPWGDVATLGGLVASGAEGPLRRRYGALRDQLLGLRVANPDGTLTWAGGQVVKNVSGYDLTRLHTGAYGTLGLITDVNLKVWPQPEAELTVLGTGTNPLPLLERLAVAPFWPLAADLFLGRAAAHLGNAGQGQFLLALRFGGRASANARGQSDAVALLSGAGAPDPQVLAGADSAAFWNNAAALQPDCQATGFAVAAIALPARQSRRASAGGVGALAGGQNRIFGLGPDRTRLVPCGPCRVHRPAGAGRRARMAQTAMHRRPRRLRIRTPAGPAGRGSSTPGAPPIRSRRRRWSA